jgi:hypothetical protein
MDYSNYKKLQQIQRKIKNLKSFMEENLPERVIEDFHIPGIPGIWDGISIPDIPSMDSIFNSIKDSIKKGLVDPVENGFNSAINTVKDGVMKTIDTVKTTLEGMVNDLKKGFDDAMAKVKGFFDDIIKKITSGFAIITDFFNDFVRRMKNMGTALKNIFGGIGTEFTGLGEGLNLGFTNIGVLFKWTGEFVFSYIMCGVQYIQNLHRCIFFYVLDTLGYMMYNIFVGIPLWILKTFMGRDLYGAMDKMWDTVYKYDSYIYGYTGFHIAHYPKNIRNLCYNCKRMKINALKNKVSEINYDFLVKMPELLNKGVVEMDRGGQDFMNAFR